MSIEAMIGNWRERLKPFTLVPMVERRPMSHASTNRLNHHAERALGTRLIGAAFLAAIASLVFVNRVYVKFNPVRVKLIETPVAATSGQVRVSTTGYESMHHLEAPLALIVRISTLTTEH